MRKLIIFDCDGTLVDSEIIAARVFTEVWASMGLTMTVDYFLRNIVGTGHDSEIMRNTRAQLPADAPVIAEKKFENALERQLKPLAGIPELLATLECTLCVASNSAHAYVVKALAVTGLTAYFGDRIYSSRDLARPKPAPDVFLHAAKTLGFAPEHCLVIEDSVSGIQAAKNAEMKVIGWTAGLHFSEPLRERLATAGADYYCHTPLELKTQIQTWLR